MIESEMSTNKNENQNIGKYTNVAAIKKSKFNIIENKLYD